MSLLGDHLRKGSRTTPLPLRRWEDASLEKPDLKFDSCSPSASFASLPIAGNCGGLCASLDELHMVFIPARAMLWGEFINKQEGPEREYQPKQRGAEDQTSANVFTAPFLKKTSDEVVFSQS